MATTELNTNIDMNTGAGAGAMNLPQAGGVNLPATPPLAMLGNLGQMLDQAAVKRALPAIMVMVLLILCGGIYAWMQETPYRPIFPGMAEADQQTAMETLKAANFKPRLDAATGNLMVPTGRFHEARILLASQGLPKNQSRGVLDTLKDQSAMTTSQFMEQARYAAAIEQELAKSITQISTIQSARVHLAQSKQSVFVRDRTPAKASVVVTPFGGRAVTPNQVQAIVHLVASSVPYLSAEDVSIVDHLGNLLTTKAQGDPAMGLTASQLQLKQQVEETYRNRIVQLLEPVVGEGNVRAQVDLNMNFTQIETTSEDFDLRKEGPKTRSEALSEERATQMDPQGIPGALANTPPPDPGANGDVRATEERGKDGKAAMLSKSTRNYELDKLVRHVKNHQGGVERLSAAVVIKERPAGAAPKDGSAPAAAGYSPEEVERLLGLVRGVVGYNQERGDVVSLVPAKFEMNTSPETGILWYENDMVVSAFKVGLATLVLIVVLLSVVRPVIKSYLPADPVPAPVMLPPSMASAREAMESGVAATSQAEQATALASADSTEAAAEADSAELSLGDGESIEDFKERMKKMAPKKKSSISADMLDTANTYDDKVALVRMLVSEDSGRVATVLKNMIKRDQVG